MRARAPRLVPILVLALVLLLLVGCGGPPQGGGATPTIATSVDPTIEPTTPALPDAADGGPRPLATATFDGEPQPDFVANELLVVPEDASALDAFLARHAGVVLETIETPGARTRYLVRVDAGTVDPIGIDEVFGQLALGSGALAVSSDAGLRLLALAARETAAGVDVSVNWLAAGDTFEDGSVEGGFDVMTRSYMEAGRTQDIGVDQAWLALERSGVLDDPDHRVDVGVIDGGFFDNADFATPSTHLSYVQGDAALGSASPVSCSGGSSCPRHGTGAALTMAGLADNGFGGAGPAGPIVGRLYTAHVALDAGSVMSAASYMQASGVAVINMSFSGTLSGTWAWWSLDDYAEHLQAISQSGVVLVASAGNDDTNVDAGETYQRDPKIHYPCEFDRVICVGALANDATDKISYSNYGGFNRASRVSSQGTVDLWAPTNIWVADTTNPGAVRTFGGTSAASPFAAGVIALIRAADPTVPLGDTFGALWGTASSGSSDPEVGSGVWPNARDAVLQILGDVAARIRIEEPSGPYDEYDAIPLRALLDDLDSPVSEYDVQWGYENHVGTFVSLGSTKSGETRTVRLCDGTYEIRAEAVHPVTSANASTSVQVVVEQPATPPARCAPSIAIVTPDDGAVFASGAAIAFEAVIDDDDATTDAPIFPVVWRADGPTGAILAQDVLSFATSELGPGTYDVHVAYGVATDTVTIEVLDTDNEAPNAGIIAPDDGEVFNAADYGYPVGGIEVDLGGLASDPEDGPIPAQDLIWSYRRDGATEWIEIGAGALASVTLPYGGSAEDWQIRLSATDSGGLVGTDVVTVTVIPPPL